VRVYFLRHGIAADRDEFQGDDFERPLTDEGCERMQREAKAIAKLQIEPDVIVTSPLVRAKQTAQIVADALKLDGKLVEDKRVGENFGVQQLAQILADHAKADALMLVGHEPDMSDVIGQLTGGTNIDLKKGGLALVELQGASSSSGQLQWLIPPKVLVR
jgi:phosphohistidine phosphatase